VTDTTNLPDGDYPFIHGSHPLADMVFIEAPRELESFLKAQAEKNGTSIVRDEVVELRCQSDAEPEALFVVFWPYGTERIHVLVPKAVATGRA